MMTSMGVDSFPNLGPFGTDGEAECERHMERRAFPCEGSAWLWRDQCTGYVMMWYWKPIAIIRRRGHLEMSNIWSWRTYQVKSVHLSLIAHHQRRHRHHTKEFRAYMGALSSFQEAPDFHLHQFTWLPCLRGLNLVLRIIYARASDSMASDLSSSGGWITTW